MIPEELQEDFRKFLYVIWTHLKLPAPTPRQYEIAHFLQHGPRREVIEAFRGVGKSWITAAFVLWCLCRNPELNIMVVSASKSRAENFTVFVRRLIEEVPILQWLAPRTGQRDSKSGFDVGPASAKQTPSVVSLGITGQLTGNRADIIIADDIEIPNNADTQTKRAKLSEQIKEFDAILKPGRTSRVIYLGTPQTEHSIYLALPDRGYAVRIWPAEYPNEAQQSRPNYGERLSPTVVRDVREDPAKAGKSTEPTRFSEADLSERRASYGSAGYALQFLLDTTLSDVERYPLRLSDLCVFPLDPNQAPERLIWCGSPEYVISDLPNVGLDGDRLYRPLLMQGTVFSPYQGKVMAIDPSGKGKDETAYAIVGILHGLLFLLDAGAVKGFDPDSLNTLALVAKKYNVNSIIAEENYGGGMFAQLFRPVLHGIHTCDIQEVRHSRQKELRIIDTLEPIVSQHRLIVDHNLVARDFRSTETLPLDKQHLYRLFYQFTRITRDRGSLPHDDRLDALSMGVAHWMLSMGMSNENAVERQKQRRLENDLAQFMSRTEGSVFATFKGATQSQPASFINLN